MVVDAVDLRLVVRKDLMLLHITTIAIAIATI